jgi:hypothetical protein
LTGIFFTCYDEYREQLDTVSLEKTTSTDSLHSSHACWGYKSIPYLGRFPEAYWLRDVGIAVEQQHQQDSWAG